MIMQSSQPEVVGASRAEKVRHSPWTNVYGLARSLLALNTLIVLLFHDADSLFRPLGQEVAEIGNATFVRFSLFTLLSGDLLGLARLCAMGILVAVIAGWRPRVTGVLHWWVSWSYVVSAFVLEGGDQITAILTLLLVPITLLDPRRSHWDAPAAVDPDGLRSWMAHTNWIVIRLQVAFLYLHASLGKVSAVEWANGTAVYYWFIHPLFGVADWLQPVLLPLLSNAVVVTGMTWGVILLELSLFTALVMPKRYWPRMLALGLAFHCMIIVVHGLVSFFLAMAGALVLYLRPLDRPFGGYRVPATAPAPVARLARLVPRAARQPAAAMQPAATALSDR